MRRLRRERRRRRFAAFLVLVLAAALLSLVRFTPWASRTLVEVRQRMARLGSVVGPAGGGAPGTAIRGLVLAVTREGDPSGAAELLLVAGVGTGRGGIVLVPTNLLATVPGVGMERMGRAFGMVGGGAVTSTLRGLLGLSITHWASLPDVSLAKVLEAASPLDLEVETPVVSASGQVAGPGPVRVGGAEALAYVLGGSQGEGEVARLERLARVLAAALEKARERPEAFGLAWRGAAGLVSDLPSEEVGDFFSALASLPPGSTTTVILPVARVDTGEAEEVYRFDPSGRQLVEAALGFLKESSAEAATVLILNGNGVPETGARVAALLPPGFYVVSQGNAGSFDYATTMIYVSRWDERHLELARRVREALGLGEVGRDPSGQTVADIVIIVGLDFAAARPQPTGPRKP